MKHSEQTPVSAGGGAATFSLTDDTATAVTAVLDDLRTNDVAGRIWKKDHRIWQDSPEEITNRLGWLTVITEMKDRLAGLQEFARETRDAGFRHVVLMGMGGSSLGPEVARQTFGSAPGYPELIVLDSIVPDCVSSVSKRIDPSKTMFLFSSKSGGTIEPLSCYRFFRQSVENAVGKERAGRHFTAVTDPNTSLASLARSSGFCRVFENPPDIGGRYSVLSWFGLVPMALAGIDVEKLLDRAGTMSRACAREVQPHDNPGAVLGTVLGVSALQGRNKLTLITSPAISAFSLWVEQLIAESLGKQGKGIVPVAGEPLVSPEYYGEDRLFVYLRLREDENDPFDRAAELIRSAGHPVVLVDLHDSYDLGAEFYRWEFATAVAGAVLGVHPFDQPDVQQSKDLTGALLQKYRNDKKLPEERSPGTFTGLLQEVRAGDYFAIMAFVCQTPDMDRAFMDLRRRIMERYGIATTQGYGPRFLHSTGQLHKGGPNSGLFLQVTSLHGADMPIPGEPYSFGVLADAQAQGDLQALQQAGRRVARIQVPPAGVAEIEALAAQIK